MIRAQVLLGEVGDADRADQPVLLELDERAPRLDVLSPALGLGQWMRCRSVRSSPRRSSEPRTDAIASSYAWWRPGILLATTHLVAGQPGAAERLADLGLVLVVHRRVEQPVAGLEGARPIAAVPSSPRERIGAEADRGEGGAVVEDVRRDRVSAMAPT